MLKIITVSTLAAMAFAFTASHPAQAENGQIAIEVGGASGRRHDLDERVAGVVAWLVAVVVPARRVPRNLSIELGPVGVVGLTAAPICI